MCHFHLYFIKSYKLFMSLVQVNPSLSCNLHCLSCWQNSHLLKDRSLSFQPLSQERQEIPVVKKENNNRKDMLIRIRMQKWSAFLPLPDAVERDTATPELSIQIWQRVDCDLDHACWSNTYVRLTFPNNYQ